MNLIMSRNTYTRNTREHDVVNLLFTIYIKLLEYREVNFFSRIVVVTSLLHDIYMKHKKIKLFFNNTKLDVLKIF